MLTLEYRLDPIAATKLHDVDLASTDSNSLRYHLFPGDIVVLGTGADFSARWGWVQVLDFALSLQEVEATLRRDREAQLEFTESSATLDFRVENDDVCVSSTYAPGLLTVSVTEFHEQVGRFARRVVEELCGRYPRLALNPEIRRLD